MQNAHNLTNIARGPLSRDAIAAAAPAVFADAPHPRVSATYGFVPTRAVVDALDARGLTCIGASQSKSRNPEGVPYTRHILQFTAPWLSQRVLSGDPLDFRVVISNSHNRGGAYVGTLGVYRHACTNSLVTYLGFGCFRVPHTRQALPHVLDATSRILEELPQLEARITRYQSTELTAPQQHAFAARALRVRFGDDAPIPAVALLRAERPEDDGEDLWRVFNRVQEHVIRGGVGFTTSTADATRHRRTRRITSPARDLRVNQQLWSLVEDYATAAV